MEFLAILIGCILCYLLVGGTNKAIDFFQKRQLTSGKKELASDKSPIKYDPHYTRKMEEEQGLRVVTQCDDSNCTTCYWKARNLQLARYTELPEKRKEFINSLPDGLSDELYESMSEDWLKEIEPLVEKLRREQVEIYHSTPYELVQKYKAEGRVYNKGSNSWSSPKVMFGRGPLMSNSSTPSAAGQKILDANKKHWQKRHPDAKPREIKAKVSSNTIVIADFEQWMRHSEQQEAGKRALASGAKAREESRLLLLKAQMLEDNASIARYKNEIKMFEQTMKEIKQKMRDWERDVQRNIRV